MAEKLIISVDDFRLYANTSDSFDAEFITPLIIQATDTLGEGLMGTALVKKLITDYNANNLAGIYEEMHPLVTKTIVWQSYMLGLPRMLYRVGNGQITKGTSSGNSDPIDSSDLANLQRGASSTLVTYENKLKAFLKDNFALIPEFEIEAPEYLKPNLEKGNTSQGTTYTPNITYTDF